MKRKLLTLHRTTVKKNRNYKIEIITLKYNDQLKINHNMKLKRKTTNLTTIESDKYSELTWLLGKLHINIVMWSMHTYTGKPYGQNT